MASLLSSQVFICRQEGVLDLSDGKSCWVPLEGSAFGPDEPCGGSEGDREGLRGLGVFGEGAPLADPSPGKELRLSKEHINLSGCTRDS